MMSQLAGWWASLCSTHRNIKKLPRYMQLHDILTMKAWFKQIFCVKGHEKSIDTVFYYFFIFKISSLLTEI
jgi:hypothetical protein